MRKKLLAPIMLLCAVCLCALTACGPSVEDLIREDLTSQFDVIKNGGEEFVSEIEQSAGEDFASLGVDTAEFTAAYLNGFDYSIDEVTVKDDTATATVTVTCKSLTDILNNFQNDFYAQLESTDLETLADQDALMQMAGETLMSVTQAAEPKSTECTFTYTNDGEGNWSADESAANELMAAMAA